MFAAAGTLLNVSKRAQNQGKVCLVLFCKVVNITTKYLTVSSSFIRIIHLARINWQLP